MLEGLQFCHPSQHGGAYERSFTGFVFLAVREQLGVGSPASMEILGRLKLKDCSYRAGNEYDKNHQLGRQNAARESLRLRFRGSGKSAIPDMETGEKRARERLGPLLGTLGIFPLDVLRGCSGQPCGISRAEGWAAP